MFGYVVVNRRELNTEDTAKYQKTYCGLCRQLKEFAGIKGQMLINYDMTFLVLLLSGLYEMEAKEQDFRCLIHPFSEKKGLMNSASEYCAAMDVALSYHNLIDKKNDDGSVISGTLAEGLRGYYQKAKEQYPKKIDAIEKYMSDLGDAEARGEGNIDLVAGFTGDMMAELFDYKNDETWSRELRATGYYLGKFIYLMDAYEDLKKDESKGNYNPLLNLKKESPEDFESFCRMTLTTYMSECAKAFERLPIIENAEILRNIIYSGVWTKYEYLQLKEQKKSKAAKETKKE